MWWIAPIVTLASGCSLLFGLDRPVRADAAAGDSAVADASFDAPEESVFALSGARWLLPCLTPLTNPTGACTCPVGPQAAGPYPIGGPPNVSWLVSMRIRGAMEAQSYAGGVASAGGFYTGGSPANSNENLFAITVSAPSEIYYLNNGTITSTRTFVQDYMVDIQIDVGATVTFIANGQDGRQWQNNDGTGQPNVIAGITDPSQPYDGQFARIDVLSVTAK